MRGYTHARALTRFASSSTWCGMLQERTAALGLDAQILRKHSYLRVHGLLMLRDTMADMCYADICACSDNVKQSVDSFVKAVTGK